VDAAVAAVARCGAHALFDVKVAPFAGGAILPSVLAFCGV
jgi:hypothetical protein